MTSDELADLEAALMNRSAAMRAPAGLRERIRLAVGRELVRPTSTPAGNGWMQFASALAAAVLIGLTAALSSTPSVSRPESRILATDRGKDRSELRLLLPDLDEKELDALLVARISNGPRVTGTVGIAPR